MNPNYIVIAVVGILVVGAGLVYFGIIDIDDILGQFSGNQMPDPIDSEPVPEFDNFDIWQMLCQITDKGLDRETTYMYIDRLNMEVFGSDTSYVDIYGEYSLYYENKGWDIIVREFPTFPDGAGAVIAYSNDINVASVMTASTGYIQSVYGYNTMTLTSYGTAGDYAGFYEFCS